MKHYWLLSLLLFAPPVIAGELPRPDHIVIVIEENKSFTQIIGNHEAPYINALAQRGLLFTQSYGVAHPSQPNYLALFTGTTRAITSDVCPLELGGDNLAADLQAKRYSFASYAESMPEAGYEGCMYGAYMRKHNPLANWKELKQLNQPYSAFPQHFENLATIALVIPDQRNDMHDGSISQGDDWLKQHIEPYLQWALAHNSLLILTWDEDDGTANNHIVTIMIGPMVRRGSSAQRINHYNILRTLSEMYGLPSLNESAHVQPIIGVWQ